MSVRPLAVALPTSTFLPALGGAEVGLHNIALRLHARGHRPVVVASAPHVRRLREEGWRLPYEVVPFPPKVWGVFRRQPALGFFLLDRFFAGLQRRYGFDVWHATMGYPTGVALVHFARKAGGIPHLVRCAGEDIQRDAEIGYGARLDEGVDRLVRRWLPRADRLIAITESVAREYRALGVAEERIAAVPNGVDLARFAQDVDRRGVRRALGVDDDRFLFLSVGRNHPKKGFATAIRAASALRAQGGLDFALLLVGEGVPDLRGAVRDSGVEDTVILKGSVTPPEKAIAEGPDGIRLPPDELVALYKAADAFVFPSRLETFGIVLAEAMAAGLPVIAADAPGSRDVVSGGRDGLLVPAGDADALARGMARLMTDAGLARDYAARALLRARDFDWERVVDRYLDLYAAAAGKTPIPPREARRGRAFAG